MIDFHSHLIPGVDDGASDVEQSREALRRMQEEGVRALITTPHVQGSVTADPALLADFLATVNAGWVVLRDLAATEFPALRVEQGLEVMLDTPSPDLSDPRVRLAGTRFVLVEFPHMMVPPHSAEALFELKMRGWTPVVAHPERYGGLDERLAVLEEWRRVGAFLQVNSGSILGRYGEEARTTAWRLLRRGWADFMSSDYHARGRLSIAEAWGKLEEKGGAEQAELLFRRNPGRLLGDEPPEPVPPLELRSRSMWRRLFRRGSD